MIRTLVKELEIRKNELKKDTIETIYFGGGTPSLLTANEVQLFIGEINKNYQVVKSPEITLEANPDDLTTQRINEYRNTQINRLSIGVQSFFDEDLLLLNRAHNAREAIKSLNEARKYFNNITIDLIYGLPNMTNNRWKENLQIAFDSGVNHISSYALTVEPKTALANFIRQGKYPQISESLNLEHFKILVKETDKHGFIQYETSNFGKPGFFSKHNTSYWQGKKYLGIGPSAHSYDGKQRSWNISNNVKYIKAVNEGTIWKEFETLSVKDKFNEMVMTGLRTIWGVSLHEIESNFGKPYKEKLLLNAQRFIDEKLLVISNEKEKSQSLKVTKKGKFLCDGIASDLFILN